MKVSSIIADAQVISAGRSHYQPKISIVTPTYCRNAEGLLLRCLDSAAVQTFADFEHIIIDDGSTDGSQAVLTDAALRDDRIVYIRHDLNSGLPGVRTNEGIMRARGDAIAFLFDDNVLAPDFLEKAWQILESSDADVIITNVEMLTNNGESFFLGGWPQTIELMRNLNTIPNGGVLVRRSFFERFGLYDPHLILRRVCDWDLWLRALRLGAKFVHLDTISAVEYGLISPNSLGNTIAWDVKVAYGYMMDERYFSERSKKLTPERIVDIDVLDPTPFFPYLRDTGEWLEVVKTFYEPFYRRKNSDRVVALTNRQSVIMPNAKFARFDGPARRRILVVSNVANAWVGTWLSELRRDPGLIVLNTPEWNLSAFKPKDIDLLMLFDCAYVSAVQCVRAFQDAGVPIVYLAGHGLAVADEAGENEVNLRDFGSNSDVASTFKGYAYFAQQRTVMTNDQRNVARQLATASTMFIGSEAQHASLDASCARVDLPTLPATLWKMSDAQAVGLRQDKLVTFDVSEGCLPDARERVVPPNHAVTANAHVRPSWESLGALVQVREDVCVAIDMADYDRLPALERFGIASMALDNRVELMSTTGRFLNANAAEFEAFGEWMRNFVRLVTIHRNATNVPTIGVFLNSEMFSGSEVYGLSLASNLSRLGAHVRVFVPEQSVYGSESGLAEIDGWLKRNGLAAAERAPYAPGNSFLYRNDSQRTQETERLRAFLDELRIETVMCSGFMPVFAAVRTLLAGTGSLYMALFQPSAYDITDLSYLRGRVNGVLSDCDWSLGYLSQVLEGPAQVVRTTLPLDASIAAPTRALPGHGTVHIAIGGTLQPRKRQLEAVLAAAKLRDAGYDITLNIYGYALSMLDDYVCQIDEQIAQLGLAERVHRFGLVQLGEVAAGNDIILSASLDESMPQTMLEMLRSGLVGVAVLSGGIDEILKDGQTGYLTYDASVDGIVAVLRRAIDDRANWADRVRQTQAILARDYSQHATTSALVSLMFEGSNFGEALRPKAVPRMSEA
ncbi:glycosyltransferase [Pseudomonas putida]|uniref:glycosyltransferase n=1 Tax=Pseudomonas putida TaxID=303 RepID=UPI003D981B3D